VQDISVKAAGLFDPEFGGDVSFRNVFCLSTDYTALISENNTLQKETWLQKTFCTVEMTILKHVELLNW
jgi:hypothetical protein